MEIKLTRSWLPWGRPNVFVNLDKYDECLHIEGCWKKQIITEYVGMAINKNTIKTGWPKITLRHF